MQQQLNEVLLSKNNATKTSTKLDAKWLSKLFQPDDIRSFDSNRRVEQIGGYVGLQRLLKTSLQNGLNDDLSQKNWRRETYGNNQTRIKESKTLWELVLQNFEDQTIQILCFAAIVSLVLGIGMHGIQQGWLQGVSIILAVVIISAVTSVNNYMKQKQFRKLFEIATRKKVNVIRNGEVQNLSTQQLLVGDIVQIQTGQILSVDGIVFKASCLHADQSAMTGQSKQIKKYDLKNGVNESPFMVSGSKILQGTGYMMVLAVGPLTRQGLVKQKLEMEQGQTPLQQKLQGLAQQIGILGMWSAGLTFAALLLHIIYGVISQGNCFLCAQYFSHVVGAFIIAVSILVIAVPQGLPLAVTISLAYSVGKMKEQNNLVRELSACQTMGGANNICTDKTGTLTKNMMEVTHLWAESQEWTSFIKQIRLKQISKNMLCIGACLNSDAQPKINQNNKFQQIGNKTQCALLQMAYKMGYDFQIMRKKYQIIAKIPFSSARKKMSVVVSGINSINNNNTKSRCIFTKGAPDFLFSNCTHYVNSQGKLSRIDENYKVNHLAKINSFSSKSLRTLLLCYRQLDNSQSTDDNLQLLENNLVIVGLVGIKDPLKSNVPNAVLTCKHAGIYVRMVTGDNTQTATAIAKQANIIPKNFIRPQKGKQGYYVVLQGKQFRQAVGELITQYTDEQKKKKTQRISNMDTFKKIVKQLRVLARSSPQDKYTLVTGLKQLQDVVAVTGDGPNDAPALKNADIGFAMGIAGSQIAREASGIILLDDDFSSVVTAIKYGRNIFDCIRKFLQFQLTVNIVAIFMAFLGAVIIKQSPLNPVQMLWVNLIMDTLAALALATEPPHNDLLLRMPYKRSEQPITPQMWKTVILTAIFQIVVLSIILFKGDQIFDVPSSIGILEQNWSQQTGQHFSIFFNVFVYLQVFNFFNARKLKRQQVNMFADIGDNYLFLAIVVAIFCCQLFIIQFGGKALQLVPLEWQTNVECIIIGSLSILWNIIIKTIIPSDFLNSFQLFKPIDSKTYDVDEIFKKISPK